MTDAAGGQNQAKRPTQAVILAGGRGSRLGTLTDSLPKPMLPFHGRPFLAYLLEMLAAQGIERVLLLTGYLGETIEAHFGDGRACGLHIDYDCNPPEDDTGTRLAKAKARIDPVFLLLYCDNYWPLRLDAMWQGYCEAGLEAQVTVYANRDGYTRDNLRVSQDGLVEVYDKSRTAPDLAGVDIGFLILRREVLDRLPSGNPSFEAEIYPGLVARRQLGAFVSGHRYYSVSTPERLAATEDFLARRPTLLLDRDGVLNRRMPKAEYVRGWSDWQWLPGSLEALRSLKQHGVRVAVVTNQAGIARGMMTEDDLAAIHTRMRDEAAAAGGEIAAVYHCPHSWDAGCDCRKPKPGMLYTAQRELLLDLSRTPFMGDDERDRSAAEAAGCPFEMISDQRPLRAAVQDYLAATDTAQRTAHG